MLAIERIPEGIRIRNIARLIEVREHARRALVVARVRDAAAAARACDGFTPSERAWFARPLCVDGASLFPGVSC